MNLIDQPRSRSIPGGVTEGVIAEWQDAKGFGWIQCGDKKLFCHAKDFARGQRRPVIGEAVTFSPGMDPKGRSCAKGIRLVREGGKISAGGRMGAARWIVLGALLVLPLLAVERAGFAWWMGACWIGFISLVTYSLYAVDKKRAQAGQWRIPEAQLHFMEMLGGWPGGWIAQQRLRHKVVKGSYQFLFWGIVLLYQVASADWISGGMGTRKLLALLVK